MKTALVFRIKFFVRPGFFSKNPKLGTKLIRFEETTVKWPTNSIQTYFRHTYNKQCRAKTSTWIRSRQGSQVGHEKSERISDRKIRPYYGNVDVVSLVTTLGLLPKQYLIHFSRWKTCCGLWMKFSSRVCKVFKR
jgi:hypothetical protein